MKFEKFAISPGVVPAVGLDEVHVSVFGQEGHQLVIGPEMEENYLHYTRKHMASASWRWKLQWSTCCCTFRATEEN